MSKPHSVCAFVNYAVFVVAFNCLPSKQGSYCQGKQKNLAFRVSFFSPPPSFNAGARLTATYKAFAIYKITCKQELQKNKK